jgi:4-hydroxyphenylpyruvate dioxygenase
LIERQGITPLFPNITFKKSQLLFSGNHPRFIGIDHLVLNVGMGELEKTVTWYEKILGFQREQTFTIETEQSGLYSQVLVHPSSNIKFPINEPLSTNSQIQEFINLNQGSGIQHIALKTTNIIDVVKELRERGVKFLSVPDEYYHSLTKPNISDVEWQEIVKQKILIDYDFLNLYHPLLCQIFTKPIFGEPTFFFELIERRNNKQGFGERNFQALFKAIEEEQAKRGTL